MKKMMMIVMAAMAIGFASCGNKAQQAPADEVVADSTAAAFDVETAINEATAQLSEQIEAKDANKLQQVIEAIQAKVAEILKQNPDAAKEYVTKVQDFLKENAEQIKSFVGENAAAQAAVNALTATPAETIVNGLMQAVDGVKAAGEDAADAAKEAAEGAVNNAKQAGQDAVDAAKQKANEEIDNAANKAADEAKKALGI
jgi:hypothetical protein